MIRVSAVVDSSGFLERLEAVGHGGLLSGTGDPLCAAVSVLLRTYGRLAEVQQGLVVGSRAAVSGDYCVEVRRSSGDLPDRWFGVGSFVLKGLADLASDYPDNLIFNITVSDLEVNHGS